jgi:hypothetical protein
MAIFAAMSVIVIKLVPGIPIVGVSGSNIKFDAMLAPIYGLIIGPYLGFTAALFGGLITAGSPFDILTSFSPAVSALIAGFLTQKGAWNGESRVKGWMVAAIVSGALIVGWYTTDVGRQAPFYPVLHFAGLGLILGSRGWTAKVFRQEQVEKESWHAKSGYMLGGITVMVVAYMFTQPYASDMLVLPYLSVPMFLIGAAAIVYSLFGIGRGSFVLAVSIASYCGIIADHMLGNLVFINTVNLLIPLSDIQTYFLKPLGLPNISALFMYMIPVSAAERILLTVVGTILAVGLVLSLRRASLLIRRQ